MKTNVTSGCILPSIAGGLLKIHICHFTPIRYQCSCYCDRSIIKDKLLEEEYNFFCVAWFLLEGYLWKFTFFTSHVFAKHNVSFVVIRQ